MLVITNSGHETKGSPAEVNVECSNAERLKQWQVQKYRMAVDEHRAELSHKLGRCVGWFEAERDFYDNSIEGFSDAWRHEFCGLMCEKRSTCLLALHFSRQKRTALQQEAC